MANVLKDLIVDRVSFVDRAAVRDPENPDEPQRYLFWKAERPSVMDVSTSPPPRGTVELVERARRWAEQNNRRELLAADGIDDLLLAYLQAMKSTPAKKAEEPAAPKPARPTDVVWRELAKAEEHGDAETVKVALQERPELAEAHRELVQKRAATALQEAEARAQELRKSERWLTKDQALAQVYESDPELFARAVAYEGTQTPERQAQWRPGPDLPDRAIAAMAAAIRKCELDHPSRPGLGRALAVEAAFNAMRPEEVALYNRAVLEASSGEDPMADAIAKAERLVRG